MNRRVTLVTALSVAGTAAVAAMSFAIVYEPADDPSAGVPLLDTTIAGGASTGDSSGTDLPDGLAPLPTSVNPAAPIVAAPPTTAAPASPAPPAQGGRSPAAASPSVPTAPTAAPTITASPVTAPANPPPPSAAVTTATTQPTTTAAPSTTPAPVTTTAARPEGVPADWPANKPIPPMPAGCAQPQLEDNGVWNCQH